MPTPPPNSPRLHEAPANVYKVVYSALLWGMVGSTVLFALGVLRALSQHLSISLGPAPQWGWAQTWTGLAHLDPTALMIAATVLLILTPVARVAVAFAAFAVDRDAKFTLVTGIVLAVIVLTVILGRLGLH
ncbi:MAG TPA: DUF1634 domain-containing protein [Terriglobales bacterium]|jgi:hypothetical protein